MNTAPPLALFLPSLAGSLLWVLCAALFATLHRALLISQEAGLQRLIEKYPDSRERIARHEPRWDTLRAAVRLAAVTGTIGTLATVLYLFPLQGPRLAVTLGLLAATIIIFSLLLFTLPRALSESYADMLSVRMLSLAAALSWLLWPLARPLAVVEKTLMNWAWSGSGEVDRPSHEDEIRSLVDQAPKEELEEEEREIIRSVFEFGETVVREIMTPRVDMTGVAHDQNVEECVREVRSAAHSRFPVYRDTIDDVVGTVHVKDLLRLLSEGQGQQQVGEVAKEVSFVPGTMPINDLLSLLRTNKEQVAVVVDEYGGTAGLVTMEDIIEELVGDIHDEYDTEGHVIQRIADNAVVIAARTPVDEVNELLDLAIPEGDEYDSIGGFVSHALGRIPHPGEVLREDGFEITVQSANARQLQTLHVSRTAAVGETSA